jgi:hypothetical protein
MQVFQWIYIFFCSEKELKIGQDASKAWNDLHEDEKLAYKNQAIEKNKEIILPQLIKKGNCISTLVRCEI